MKEANCEVCGKTIYYSRKPKKYCEECRKKVRKEKQKQYETSDKAKARKNTPEAREKRRLAKRKWLRKKYPYDPNAPYKKHGHYTDEEMKAYRYSEEWAEKCKQVKAKANYTCARCGKKQTEEGWNFIVHHKTYANYRREPLSDLECLCNYCHAKEHGIL